MSQTPEGKVKSWLDRQLKARYKDIWYYKAPGGRFGKAGTPDLLICIHGLFIAIEVKSDKGSVTLKQDIEHDLITKAGGLVIVLYGKTENIFDIIDKYIQSKIHTLN